MKLNYKWINVQRSPLRHSQTLRHAHCIVHNKDCSVSDKVAFVHIAGTSCTSWSPAGLQEGETAMSHAHFLAWSGIRKKTCEPLIIQECTDAFPRRVFHEVLPEWDWVFAVLTPESFGIPVRRVRQWAV